MTRRFKPKTVDGSLVKRNRVFVTGIGLVTPHGCVLDQVFDEIYQGKSAVRMIRSGTPEFGSDVLVASTNFDPAGEISKIQILFMDRVSQMAVVAARLALENAGLLSGDTDLSTTGVYTGCALVAHRR